jgi:alpha-N-arabinofuranosidase
MTGIMEFAGIWKKRSQVYATPAYYVFKMFASADAAHRVSATANSGTYSVAQGVDRLPEIAAVPYLDVVATVSQDNRKLTLFCVNRSLDIDIASTIRLEHFDSRKTAAVHLLSATSINDANDEMNPLSIEPVDTAEAVQPAGWSHVFPHASVTVISIDRK